MRISFEGKISDIIAFALYDVDIYTHPAGGYHPPKPAYFFDDENTCRIKLWLGYTQCCGLRELGSIVLCHDQKTAKKFVEDIYNWVNANMSIGALTYTEVFGDKEMACPYSRSATSFISFWPGEVSYGHLWYNPNSGNWVRIVTLQTNYEQPVEEENDN